MAARPHEPLVTFVLVLSACTGSCTPAGDRGAASVEGVTGSAPVADASAPRQNVSDAGDAGDAGESGVSPYFRREWAIKRAGGAFVFEAPGSTRCTALPEARPQGLVLILVRRGGEGGDWTYYGVTDASPCRFPWSMPWMAPPPGACRVVSAGKMDELYQELRRLSFPTIRTRKLEHISPHRGGWSVNVRYGDVECGVSDILDSEVLPEDEKRFDAAQNLVRGVYQEAEDAGAGP